MSWNDFYRRRDVLNTVLSHARRSTESDCPSPKSPVSRAWRQTATDHEALRTVLGTHVNEYPALLALRLADQRMLAVTTGVADPAEPIAEMTKVGIALDTLPRHGPAKPARRPRPCGRLLRVLAASS